VVSAAEAAAQTGPYIQMGMGTALAPPLAVHGSADDWSAWCDLIINPQAVDGAGDECDTAPPRSSWTNAFGGGAGTAVALGYDCGRASGSKASTCTGTWSTATRPAWTSSALPALHVTGVQSARAAHDRR
jgi:hypothetical protein